MSSTYWLFIFIIFGLVFGSFLNVVICRIDELETIWFSRSHCPKCQKVLAWYDLIPLFSFLILKTRCRFCRQPISWQYPFVELATPALIGIFFYRLVIVGYLSIWAFLPLIIYFGVLVVIFVYDLKTMTIPMEITAVGFLSLMVHYLIEYNLTIFLNALASMVILALIPVSIILIGKLLTKKDVMGAGDIFLASLIGFALNIEKGILALVISFILGGIISLILILIKKVKFGDYTEIAFGPFLILGGLISLYFGNLILSVFII